MGRGYLKLTDVSPNFRETSTKAREVWTELGAGGLTAGTLVDTLFKSTESKNSASTDRPDTRKEAPWRNAQLVACCEEAPSTQEFTHSHAVNEQILTSYKGSSPSGQANRPWRVGIGYSRGSSLGSSRPASTAGVAVNTLGREAMAPTAQPPGKTFDHVTSDKGRGWCVVSGFLTGPWTSHGSLPDLDRGCHPG